MTHESLQHQAEAPPTPEESFSFDRSKRPHVSSLPLHSKALQQPLRSRHTRRCRLTSPIRPPPTRSRTSLPPESSPTLPHRNWRQSSRMARLVPARLRTPTSHRCRR